MTDKREPRSHPNCWTGIEYVHTCAQPSGRACVDCGAPAGTPWGPYWCPTCDVTRLDRIAAGFRDVLAAFDAQR